MYAQLVSRLMVWETILPNWEKACNSSASVVLLFNYRGDTEGGLASSASANASASTYMLQLLELMR